MSVDPAAIRDLPTFLAHALAIEQEAALRYRELSAQMATHYNVATASLFQKLAVAEAQHAAAIAARAKDMKLPALAPWEYRWLDPESPESAPFDDAHYLMTPHHALAMALAAEKRAKLFFETVAAGTTPEIAALAREFAGEEAEHVARVETELARAQRPAADWAVDHDEPVAL